MVKGIIPIVVALLISGCTVWPQGPERPIHRFRLMPELSVPATRQQPPVALLAIARPEPYPGFRSRAMRYVQRTSQLDAYAWHEWVEPLDEQLQRVLIDALEHYRVARVVQAPSPEIPAAFRLESELLYLQQDLRETPRVQLALRVRVLDLERRCILASRLFQAEEAMMAVDPYQGVQASNRLLTTLLPDIGDFVMQTLRHHTPESATSDLPPLHSLNHWVSDIAD